jgi:hypothetical protein
VNLFSAQEHNVKKSIVEPILIIFIYAENAVQIIFLCKVFPLNYPERSMKICVFWAALEMGAINPAIQ